MGIVVALVRYRVVTFALVPATGVGSVYSMAKLKLGKMPRKMEVKRSRAAKYSVSDVTESGDPISAVLATKRNSPAIAKCSRGLLYDGTDCRMTAADPESSGIHNPKLKR